MANLIHLEKVTIYQSGNSILADVSIEMEPGEFVYLIGKTGSGKSSLLKTLYAELPIVEGIGVIANFNLNTLKRKEVPMLRRKLGVVFQDFQLLTDRNVYNNLLFVLKATGWKNKTEIDARIKEAFDKVGMWEKRNKMPHELSGGEQQKVAIARALLNHPEIILADEPTGNLDPDISDDIMQLLFEISKAGCAVLMATHNYQLLEKYPSRILKCEDHKVIDSKIQSNAEPTESEAILAADHGPDPVIDQDILPANDSEPPMSSEEYILSND